MLINPRAGRGAARAVREALARHTDGKARFAAGRTLPEAIAHLRALHPSQVVVCGGDGTVVATLAAFRETGIPVGIVPTGTGNLLARNLRLPPLRADQIAVALSGEPRPLDLIALRTDRHLELFSAVVSGVGYDARLIASTDPELKRKVGALAYVVAALRHTRSPRVRARIAVDHAPTEPHRISGALLANVGRLQGGVLLFPDARPDSGAISVTLVAAGTSWEYVAIAWRAALGRVGDSPQVQRFECRHVRLEFERLMPFQQDGEARGRIRWLEARVLPHVSLVRCPGG